MSHECVSATRAISAAPEVVFAVLADPSRHAAIDGTGWVCSSVGEDRLTAAGQVFRMAMYHPDHPDGGYQTANRVTVVDPPRVIARGRRATTPTTARCASAAGCGATTSWQPPPTARR